MEEKKEISLEEVSIVSRETGEILDKNEVPELVKSKMNSKEKNYTIMEILKMKSLFMNGFNETLPQLPLELIDLIFEYANINYILTKSAEFYVGDAQNCDSIYLSLEIPSLLLDNAKLRKIEVEMISKDQGWCSYKDCDASWTWAELSLQPHQPPNFPLPSPFLRKTSYFVLPGYSDYSSLLNNQNNNNNNNNIINDNKEKGEGNKNENIINEGKEEKKKTKEEEDMELMSRSRYPQLQKRLVKESAEVYEKKLSNDENDGKFRLELLRNKRACINWQFHRVVLANGHNSEEGAKNHFFHYIEGGDTLHLWLRSIYPGWAIFVRYARVSLFFQI